MNKWLELAAKCETATGPDDFSVIAKTTHTIMVSLGYRLNNGGHYWSDERKKWFSQGNQIMISIDSITALIEQELPGWMVQSHTHDGPKKDAYARVEERPFQDDRLPMRGDAYAATEPLARCAAFCRAMAAKNPEETPETVSADCK